MPAKLRLEVGRMLMSQLAVFFERGRDDRFETRRNNRVQQCDRARRTIEDRVEDDSRRAPAECLGARHHLVEHDAERKQIGPRIEVSPRACSGDMYDTVPKRRSRRWSGCRCVLAIGDACRAPLDSDERCTASASPGRSRESSRGFLSPMKMLAGLMSRWTMPWACAASSASASWMPMSSTSATLIAPLAMRSRKRLALERLHHDEGGVVVVADVVDRADRRVAERAGGARLDTESFEGLGFR